MKHKLLDNVKKDIILRMNVVGKKEKRGYLRAIARSMDVSSRNFVTTNVYKLEKLASKNKDKIFVVPGIVLGFGDLNSQVNVYAYKYSDAALKKIEGAKGVAKSLDDLIKDKVDGKDIIFVK